MEDHTVVVDTAQTPTALAFAETFNVAVPFIDRHLAEGRGAKVAIRDAEGEVTYAALAASVNRAGNALAALGLGHGDRVLMVVKDCPLFFYLFWGRDQGGVRAGAAQHPCCGRRTNRFVIENARAACIVWSPEFAGEIAGALAEASHRPAHALPAEGEGDSFATRLGDAPDVLVPAPAAATEPGLLALHVGLDRHAQGRRSTRHRDMVVTSQYFAVETLGVTAGRHPLLCGKTVLRLRARQRHDLPAVDRRHGGAHGRAADSCLDLRRHGGLPAHRLLRRADALRRAAAGAGECGARSLQRPPLRLGRRAAARRRCWSAGRPPPGSASSTASARPRACTSSSPTGPAGWRRGPAARPCRATKRGWSTTTGATWPPVRPATC